MIDSADDLFAAASEKRHAPLLRTRVQISARVTVFFAAAGFGKTYAMIDACERLRREGASVAWLSCAALALPGDDFLQAIRRFFELFAQAEIVFIDDLHILSPGPRKALLHAFVLTGPHRKVVLATRSLEDLGVSRLLADGAVQLIQADTLHWRRRQLSELWQNRLTAKQLNFIDQLAQGWPAASQLLAYFLVEGGDINAESVLLNASLVTDYIRAEVLAPFSPEELSLLAMTSLVEAFDDALINALGKNSRLGCDVLIRRLPGLCSYKNGGALIGYNELLSLYLRRVFVQLPKEKRIQALCHAADWSAAQGDLVAAGKLAARAGDRQRIVKYVMKAGGLRIWVTRGHDYLRAVVAAADDELVAEEPRLKLLRCAVLLKDGQVKQAIRLFQEATPVLPSDPDTERGAAFVRLSFIVYGCQLADMNDAEIERAAHSLNQDSAFREIVPTVLAIMHSQKANFAAALAEISVARVLAREAGTTHNLLFLDAHSTGIALARGDLEGAQTYLSKIRRRWRMEFSTDHSMETVMLTLSAQLAFERGNIMKSRQLAGQVAHRLTQSEAWLDIYFAGYEPMFRLLTREQGLTAALVSLDRALDQLQDEGLERIASGLRHLRTCLIGEEILRGNEDLSLSLGETAVTAALESRQEKELRLLAGAYRGLANRRPEEAKQKLDTLIEFADRRGVLRSKLRALLLRQVARSLMGDEKGAAADFQSALELGAQTGMRQAFAEFGGDVVRARLMDAAPPKQVAAFAKSLEALLAISSSRRSESALTRREAQILDLLPGGDSDKAIARKLQVTEHAVRFHLKNLYRKLGVHDRNAAISRSSAK